MDWEKFISVFLGCLIGNFIFYTHRKTKMGLIALTVIATLLYFVTSYIIGK